MHLQMAFLSKSYSDARTLLYDIIQAFALSMCSTCFPMVQAVILYTSRGSTCQFTNFRRSELHILHYQDPIHCHCVSVKI